MITEVSSIEVSPCHNRTVPLFVKAAYTAFMAVLVPVYCGGITARPIFSIFAI
jgi:hypothetical protein